MRRRGRMRDEALRIAEIVRDVDEPERVEKPEAGILVPGLIPRDVEGDDGAAGAHLAPRQLVLRMARKAGIDNARHLRMAFEKPRNRLGGAALSFDPELQRLETLQQQPRIERRQ